MQWYDFISLLLNLVLGGSFLYTLFTLKSAQKEASEKAKSSELDNIEKLNNILMRNIVEPLSRELEAVRRELAKFRKAVEKGNECEYKENCPIRQELNKRHNDNEN